MKNISIAIIGCGAAAHLHLHAKPKLPNVTWLAAVDVNPDRAQKFAKEYGFLMWSTDPMEVIQRPDLTAVILALPASYRSELAITALKAGKHVLLEKPVAMNSDEVLSLIAYKGDLVVASCSSRYRFSESARFAANYIKSGMLGNILALRCRVMGPFEPSEFVRTASWRLNRRLNGGGILMNWGSYDLDYLLGLCGWSLTPDTISGHINNVPSALLEYFPPDADAEIYATAIVTFKENAYLVYERGEMQVLPSERLWQIIGEHGTLTLEMLPSGSEPTAVIHSSIDLDGLARETILWRGVDRFADINDGPITNFVESIIEGRKPMTSIEDAYSISCITDGIYSSRENFPTPADQHEFAGETIN